MRNEIELRDQDWNFRRLAQADRQELQVAVWWEYLRESETVRSFCRRWLDLSRAGKTPRNDSETQDVLYQLQRMMARMGVGGFNLCHAAEPLANDEPWLLLVNDFRVALIGQSFRSPHDPLPSDASVGVQFIPGEPVMRGFVTHLRTEFTPEEEKRGDDLEYRGEIDALGRETLPFQINWRLFTNDELVEAFKTWVELNRPFSEPKPEPTKAKGRGKTTTLYAQLTDLGTMRLLHFKTPSEVLERIHATDQSKLMRAARRARSRFKELLGTDEDSVRGKSLSKRKGRK